MHSAATENLTLFRFLIQNGVETETLCPCVLQLQQAMLLILHLHYTFITPAHLVGHHGTDSQRYFDPFTPNAGHH